MFEVKPYVECRLWWDSNLEAKTSEALEDVVALVLKVLLQSNFLGLYMYRIKER